MAGESKPKSSSRPAAPVASPSAARAFPVLVPQESLAGQPDIPLSRPVTTVGSNETARLHLVSRTVSKGHAIFVNSGAGTYVADLASRTGVLVNGKVVKDADLKYGDRVQIGKFVFRYKSISRTPAPPAPLAPPAAVIVVGWPALPVTTRVVQIGRRDTSDIPLSDDAAVSAAHAVIFQMNGKWYIRDVGSRTGTHVNGKAIHQERLNFGDRIVIGSSTILFQPSASIEEMSSEPVVGAQPPVAEIAAMSPLAMDEAIPLEGEPAAEPLGSLPAQESEVTAPPNEQEQLHKVSASTEPSGYAAGASVDEVSPPPEEPAVEIEAEHLTEHAEALDTRASREPSGSAAGASVDEASPISPEEFAFAEPLPVNEVDIAPSPVNEPAIEIEPEHLDIRASTEPSGSAAGATVEEVPPPPEAPAVEIEPQHLTEHAEALDTRASREPSGSAAGATVDEASPISPEEFAFAEPLPVNVTEVVLPPKDVSVVFEHPTVENEAADQRSARTEPSGSAAGATVEPVTETTPSATVNAAADPHADSHTDAASQLAMNEPSFEEPAAEPLGSVVLPAAVTGPISAVDEFVFVPVAETAAAAVLPEVFFWGDSETDAAPQAATTVSPNIVPIEATPPPDVADVPIVPAEPLALTIAESNSPTEIQPLVEIEPDEQSSPVAVDRTVAPEAQDIQPITAEVAENFSAQTSEETGASPPSVTPAVQDDATDETEMLASEPTVADEHPAAIEATVTDESSLTTIVPEESPAERLQAGEETPADIFNLPPVDEEVNQKPALFESVEPVAVEISAAVPVTDNESLAELSDVTSVEAADPGTFEKADVAQESTTFDREESAAAETTAATPVVLDDVPAASAADAEREPVFELASPEFTEISAATEVVPAETATEVAGSSQIENAHQNTVAEEGSGVFNAEEPLPAEVPVVADEAVAAPAEISTALAGDALVDLAEISAVSESDAGVAIAQTSISSVEDGDISAELSAAAPFVFDDETAVTLPTGEFATGLEVPVAVEFSAVLPDLVEAPAVDVTEAAAPGTAELSAAPSVALDEAQTTPEIETGDGGFIVPEVTWSMADADESQASDALLHMFGNEPPPRSGLAAALPSSQPVEPFSLPTDVTGLAIASALTAAAVTAGAHAGAVHAFGSAASTAASSFTAAGSHFHLPLSHEQTASVEQSDVSTVSKPAAGEPPQWVDDLEALEELEPLEPETESELEVGDDAMAEPVVHTSGQGDDPFDIQFQNELEFDESPTPEALDFEADAHESTRAVAPTPPMIETMAPDGHDAQAMDLDDPAEWSGITTVDEMPGDAATTLSEPAPSVDPLDELGELEELEPEEELPASVDAVDLSELRTIEEAPAADDTRHLESLAVEAPFEMDTESGEPARVEPDGEVEWAGPGAVEAIADSVALGAIPVAESALAAGLSQVAEIVPGPAATTGPEPFEFEFIEPEAIEPEPVEPAITEEDAVESPAHMAAPGDWSGVSTIDELPVGGSVTQSAPAVEAETDDLDFLEFTDVPAEPVAEIPPVVIAEPPRPNVPIETQEPTPASEAPPIPPSPVPPAAPVAKGKPTGPSLFGFEFEGGSFLGGMPLPLNVPLTGAVKAAAVAAVAPAAINALAAPITGLGAMASGIAGSGAVSLPPSAPRLHRRRPAQPPVIPPAQLFSKPTSLTGLVSEAKAPWEAGPVIPPTARQAEAKQKPARPTQPMTSTFSVPGKAARSTEVFSQMTAPIGVEVFGGKPGNPGQFAVPDSKVTAAEAAAADLATKATNTAPVSYQIPRPARRSRLPYLLVLFFTAPILIWQIAYRLMPVSSQMTGSIQFAGVKEKTADASRFIDGQKQRIISDEVRMKAAASLGAGSKAAGFLNNADDYATTIDERHLSWDPPTSSLRLVYNTSEPRLGTQQVVAILQALKNKDQDLEDALQRAQADVDAANSNINSLKDQSHKLMAQHEALVSKAEDRPGESAVAQDDQDVVAMKQKWTDARASLNGNQEALARLQNQDPNKPVDIEGDPQVIDLETQLRPLIDQIRVKKNGAGVTASPGSGLGTDVSVNATTQPAGPVDPLVVELQKQADVLQKRLDDRKSELLAMQSVDPAERAAMRARQMKDLTTMVALMKKSEQDAHTAYDAAVAKSAADHQKVDAALVVDGQMQDIMQQYQKLESDGKAAIEDLKAKEATLASCIHLNGEPMVSEPTITSDLRFGTAAIGIALACFLTGMMIVGEFRRPKPIAGFEPPAAPTVTPARLVPWPQPRDLQGLQQPARVDSEEMMA